MVERSPHYSAMSNNRYGVLAARVRRDGRGRPNIGGTTEFFAGLAVVPLHYGSLEVRLNGSRLPGDKGLALGGSPHQDSCSTA